ncbi:DUF6383 domain-containing protein [Parabacteroides sp. Marseille-P3160]|uniref:DUF6383 domain-containing protein n=1 Tax=Parabacteroides sp. Marseille-P3160 TaxID=1917887 RepID=UPI001F410A31|nr:DUF6383 domain-containing protein [Parabacteroides sp. Marseille-P3160]
MNKRFFTLLAALTLLFSSGIANAAPGDFTAAPKFENGKKYFLASTAADKFLTAVAPVVNEPYGTVKFGNEPASLEQFRFALWTVSVTAGQQGAPSKLKFINVATGRDLVVAPNATAGAELPLKGTIKEWIIDANGIYSYFNTDSIYFLTLDGANLGVAKGLTADLTSANKALVLKPYTYAVNKSLVLTADDLNTQFRQIAGTPDAKSSFNLKFEDPKGKNNLLTNYFTKKSLHAEQVGSSEYVTLKADTTVGKAKKEAYVVVDTAYIPGTEANLLAFNYDSINAANRNTKSYNFKFTYNPSSDSIAIAIEEYYTKQSTASNDIFWYGTPVTNANFVRIAYLVNGYVITLGTDAARFQTTDATAAKTATTKETGIYLIQKKTAINGGELNDAYLVVNLAGSVEYRHQGGYQDFQYLPSAQWVITKETELENSTIKIQNREYDNKSESFIQLYKVGDTFEATTSLTGSAAIDTLVFIPVTSLKDKSLGYFNVTGDANTLKTKSFTFKHFVPANENAYLVASTGKDTAVYVSSSEDGTPFQLVRVGSATAYGADAIKDKSVRLERYKYNVKVYDPAKFDATEVYIGFDATAGKYVTTKKPADAVVFDLKSYYAKDGKEYYTLIDATNKVSVKSDDILKLYLYKEGLGAEPVSTFALGETTHDLYKKFATDNNADTLRFVRANNRAEVLYESAHNYGVKAQIAFLGVGKQEDLEKETIKHGGYSFLVDTAYTNSNKQINPQYLIAVTTDSLPSATKNYIYGQYLINAVDSAAKSDDYKWNNHTRLAFVDAVRQKDSLFILNGYKPVINNGLIDLAALKKATGVKKLDLTKAADNKNVVWQFRLLKDGLNDFLIESANIVAPTTGANWVKIQNGVPVIVASYAEAELFNVDESSEAPVANEGISATDVTVVGGAGNVTIFNAAGKKVTISNILGQAVANTVLSSDQATISVPKGVVVVAVEGEKAVKAVVK